MTSQPGKQTITIHILLNISKIKVNQTMKFGQLIESNKKIFFFKSLAENEAGRLVPEFFLFIKTALYKVKVSSLQLGFTMFDSP